MTLFHILVLGLIQGLTEFLPVSSSGHLILLPRLFGWQEQGLEMDVALHGGTLVAVVLYFRKDIGNMATHFLAYCLKGFPASQFDEHVRLAFSLVVATLPAVIAGFILKKTGFGNLRQVHAVALNIVIFALVLFVSDRLGSKQKDIGQMTVGKGLLIGLSQAIALVPGVSRSGICISSGLALGFTRVAAARFAFLMSIPSITGALTLTLFDALKGDAPVLWNNLAMGAVFSMVAGLVAIHFMLSFLNRYSFDCFVIYRLLLGICLWTLMC